MNGNKVEPPVRQQDIQKYEDAWQDEMQVYWRERLMRLNVYDTGNLYRSITGKVNRGKDTLIEHRFAYYGVYVSLGVGNGYKKGNGGNLEFLQDWSTNKRKHRQKRDWYNKKYFSSVMRLGEMEAAFYGQAYQGLMAEALTDVFGGRAEQHFTTK